MGNVTNRIKLYFTCKNQSYFITILSQMVSRCSLLLCDIIYYQSSNANN